MKTSKPSEKNSVALPQIIQKVLKHSTLTYESVYLTEAFDRILLLEDLRNYVEGY